jgi:hypothetical protein
MKLLSVFSRTHGSYNNVHTSLVAGPSILVYIFIKTNKCIRIINHFIVMLSQMLLHVSAHQRHYQGAHTILKSYLSVYITKKLWNIE